MLFAAAEHHQGQVFRARRRPARSARRLTSVRHHKELGGSADSARRCRKLERFFREPDRAGDSPYDIFSPP